jgi:hypothetical protein
VVALFVAALIASRPTVGVFVCAASAVYYISLAWSSTPEPLVLFLGAQLPEARCTGSMSALRWPRSSPPDWAGAATPGVDRAKEFAARCHANGGHVD